MALNMSGKWRSSCLGLIVSRIVSHIEYSGGAVDARSENQAPVPLSIFRSNSKFDETSECSSFEYTRPITAIFCTRHDSDTVVTCAKYSCDPEEHQHEFSSNFEFDRNMLSGTGARSDRRQSDNMVHLLDTDLIKLPWHNSDFQFQK